MKNWDNYCRHIGWRLVVAGILATGAAPLRADDWGSWPVPWPPAWQQTPPAGGPPPAGPGSPPPPRTPPPGPRPPAGHPSARGRGAAGRLRSTADRRRLAADSASTGYADLAGAIGHAGHS